MLRQCFVASRATKSLILTCPSVSNPVPIFANASRQLSLRRRRKRGGNVGPSKENKDSVALNRPHKVTNKVEFAVAAQNFLDRIEVALGPMKKCNDVFIITRDAKMLSLELEPACGEYSFEIFEDNCIIALQTPISGKFSYVLNSDTKEWVNQEDGHSCEGLLVRDLIRQCKGVPKL